MRAVSQPPLMDGLQCNIRECSRCEAGGLDDGGIALLSSGVCPAFCSPVNFCGDSAPYWQLGSEKGFDCRPCSPGYNAGGYGNAIAVNPGGPAASASPPYGTPLQGTGNHPEPDLALDILAGVTHTAAVKPGGTFAVRSGPCQSFGHGRCVGRPNGYGARESCEITVLTEGTLTACPLFQTVDYPPMQQNVRHDTCHDTQGRRDTVSISSGPNTWVYACSRSAIILDDCSIPP
jgi:hypothetical protein